jgi:hypothetical protein
MIFRDIISLRTAAAGIIDQDETISAGTTAPIRLGEAIFHIRFIVDQ